MIPIKFKGSEKETVHELYYKLLDVSNQKDKKGYITHIKSINAWCLNNICINGHSFTFPEIIKADYDTLCEIAQKYGQYDRYLHAVGIVYTPRPYLVGIYTTNRADGEAIICELNQWLMAYQLMKE